MLKGNHPILSLNFPKDHVYFGIVLFHSDQSERVVDEINNQKQDMVIRAVRKMKERAQACVAVGGGVFEGRKL